MRKPKYKILALSKLKNQLIKRKCDKSMQYTYFPPPSQPAKASVSPSPAAQSEGETDAFAGYLRLHDSRFYFTHLEITGDPCNLLGSQQCNLFANHTIFFALNHISSNHAYQTKVQLPLYIILLYQLNSLMIFKVQLKDNSKYFLVMMSRS